MPEDFLLPLPPDLRHSGHPQADEHSTAKAIAWIDERVERTRRVWGRPVIAGESPPETALPLLAGSISQVLTHRIFNFQGRGRLNALLPAVRQNLIRQLSRGGPLNFFLLYNGAYRASPLPDGPPLIFAPDQTELMLLHQVALLHEKVCAAYAPGLQFSIVLNNGVALWVNDIALEATQLYVRQFRRMIGWLGAGDRVGLVVQAELPGFASQPGLGPACPPAEISEKDHRLVERFIGRRCGPGEARHRLALYSMAEARWAQDLAPLVAAQDALVFRQVAHPEMLSFRPFPGGAIRIQNGSLGFEPSAGSLIPRLITSQAARPPGLRWVPWAQPWLADAPAS